MTVAGAARAETYHVDSRSGDDSRAGTGVNQAWRSLDRVNAAAYRPGDRVCFRAGSAWTGQLIVTARGEPGRPIVFEAEGDGPRPRIDGAGRVEDAILVRNAQHVVVRGLEVTNRGEVVVVRRGVHVLARDAGTLAGIAITDLFVHDVNGSQKRKNNGGIVFSTQGPRPTRFDGLTIERNIVWRVDRSGICAASEFWPRARWFPSPGVVIRDNWLGDLGGDGVVPWATDGCLIEHNILEGANKRAGSYNAGIWPWSTDNTVMRLNRASGVQTTLDGQGFDSDYNSRNTRIEWNLSHDNEGGFLLICDDGGANPKESLGNRGTIVRRNISRHDATRGVHLSGRVDGLVEQNAFYTAAGSDIQMVLATNWHGWPRGVTFRDNLFVSGGVCRYGHEVGRIEGTYAIGPGWGPARDIVFQGNRHVGRHEGQPNSDARPSSAAPRPISFEDWPGPRFDPERPGDFRAFLAAHRAWMLNLMERQFGERPAP
jgi:hypothetical protein